MMYAVLYCALVCWVGAMTGLMLISGLLGLSGVFVVGAIVIFGRRRSTQQDALLWALAIAAERAMPLAPTLEAFAGQCRGEYRRKVLSAAHHMQQGLSLPDTLDLEPGLFPRDVEILIRVGSESGVLAGALHESSAMRQTWRTPWAAIAFRLGYLVIVLVVMQSIMAFMAYFITPKYEAIFSDFGIPLPAITILTIEASHFFIKLWPLFLLFLLFQMGLLMCSFLSVLGVLPWDLPFLERFFYRRHAALILRCLSRVVEGNRPIDRGIQTLTDSYPVSWIRRRLDMAGRDVQNGDDWCDAFARAGLIRPAEAALLASARRVGNLSWALRETAENSERRLAYRLQAWGQILIPLLVMAIGAVVFLVSVSYFTPLLLLIQRLA